MSSYDELNKAINFAHLNFKATAGIDRYKHFLYQFICGRAVLKILLVNVRIIAHLLWQVGKSDTICRTNLVNSTLVISQVKKLARLAFIHPVSVLASFPKQPFFSELTRGLSEMRRYSLNVSVCKRR